MDILVISHDTIHGCSKKNLFRCYFCHFLALNSKAVSDENNRYFHSGLRTILNFWNIIIYGKCFVTCKTTDFSVFFFFFMFRMNVTKETKFIIENCSIR